MSDAELIALVAEVLETDAAGIAADSDLEELGWDSLSNLTFLSIADDRYGRTIDPQDLAHAETPTDLGVLLGRSAA
jgi:acyl carrier protein